MIYYILIFILFVLGVVEIYISKKDRLLLYYFIYLILWFFVGFKSAGGTDFGNYKELFLYINTSTLLTTTIEPLFSLLIIFMKAVGAPFVFFWATLAALNLGIKFYVFKKYVPYLFPALLMYFVGMFIERDFDGVRQGLAMGICLLSIKYVIKDKFIPFFALVITASFVHTSSIVFVVIYFIRNVYISNKVLYYIVGAALLFVICDLSISRVLLNYIPNSIVKIKLMRYAESDVYSASVGINVGIIFRIIILVLFTHMRPSLAMMNEKLYNILKNGFALSIIMSLVFNDFAVLSHRLPYVFREFQILIIPYFYYIVRGNKSRIIVLCIVTLYSLLLMSRILYGGSGFYYEYHNLLLG